MGERVFFESQALLAAVAEAEDVLGVQGIKAKILDRIPPDKAAALNDALADLFGDQRLAEAITVQSDVEAPPTANGFGWELGRKVIRGETRKIRFYRATSVWKTQVGCIIGIAVSLGLTPLNPLAAGGAIVPTYTLISTAWDRFISLERPRDNEAIDAYEALLRAEIARNGAAPTVSEINAASHGAALDYTLAGLRKLKTLELAEVTDWEGGAENIDSPGNRWHHRF